jgi:hypothetical protein
MAKRPDKKKWENLRSYCIFLPSHSLFVPLLSTGVGYQETGYHEGMDWKDGLICSASRLLLYVQ